LALARQRRSATGIREFPALRGPLAIVIVHYAPNLLILS